MTKRTLRRKPPNWCEMRLDLGNLPPSDRPAYVQRLIELASKNELDIEIARQALCHLWQSNRSELWAWLCTEPGFDFFPADELAMMFEAVGRPGVAALPDGDFRVWRAITFREDFGRDRMDPESLMWTRDRVLAIEFATEHVMTHVIGETVVSRDDVIARFCSESLDPESEELVASKEELLLSPEANHECWRWTGVKLLQIPTEEVPLASAKEPTDSAAIGLRSANDLVH